MSINNKIKPRKTVYATSTLIMAVLILFICVPKISKRLDNKEFNIDSERKLVLQGPVVNKDGITDTNVTLTGCERIDIVNIAKSQLGVIADTNGEYSTKYNKWYEEFIKVKDSSGAYIYDPWNRRNSNVKKIDWNYLFLGWAADTANCFMSVNNDNRGFYIDANAQYSYDMNGTEGWFVDNKRAISINNTTDIIKKSIPGDLIIGKNTTNGSHYIFMIIENNGTTAKTIEGNVVEGSYNKVVSRTIGSSTSKQWNNLELMYIYKPMYRSTATFNTNGAVINGALIQEGELVFDTGIKKGGVYYKYKFFDDLNMYDVEIDNYDLAHFPDEDCMRFEGYSFGGWYDNPEFAGNRITKSPTEQIGNVDYYARWERIVNTNASSTVSKIQNGLKFSKKASWTVYEGNSLSDKGNPYIKIEFEIDPTEYFNNNPTVDKIGGATGVFFADIIPQEMDLVKGIYSEYERISLSEGLEVDTYFYTTEKKLFFRFVDGVENKTYRASFVLEVDKSEIVPEKLSGSYLLNTNGYSANSYDDGIGSSYFSGEEFYLELSSPKLKYTEITEGTEGAEGASSKMRVTKLAKYGMLDGSYFDKKGNPYFDIQFIVDLSGVSSDSMQKDLSLTDYIPKEYEYCSGTLEVSGEPTKYIFNGAKNTVEIKWEDDVYGLQGKIFYISFITKLDLDAVDMDVLNNNKHLYTNGITIDTTEESNEAAIIQSTSYKMTLASPIIDVSELLSDLYNIKYNTNGGVIRPDKNITRYTKGVGAILPSQMDIQRDGYTFAGWYDNSSFEGMPISMISKDDSGDKEFWAKWIDQSIGGSNDGINISKVARFQAYNGSLADEKGNPYVKTDITIDMSNANVGALNNIKGNADTTDVIIMFDQSINMRGNNIANIIAYTKENVTRLLKDRNNVKIAVAGYAGVVSEIVTLDSRMANDGESINNKIDEAYVGIQTFYSEYDKGYKDREIVGNNIQNAVLWAQRQFVENSTADKKEFIIITNRLAEGMTEFDSGEDVVLKRGSEFYGAIGKYDSFYSQNLSSIDTEDSLYALAQMDYAKSIINNLNVTTIGLAVEGTLNASVKEMFFSHLATEDKNEKKQYISALVVNESDILIDESETSLRGVMKQVSQRINPVSRCIEFVDYIPDAYTILDNTVIVSDSLSTSLSKDNVLTCSFDGINLQNKVYTIEFYSVLSLNKIPGDVLRSGGAIYTNGKTLDITNNSLGSAYFAYGNNKINIESPTVIFNPDVYMGEIGFNKDAKWGTYKGGKKDALGNPYLTTTLEVDLTRTRLTALYSALNETGYSDVVMLIDVSNNMKGGKLKSVIKTVKNAVSQMLNKGSDVRFAIAGYGGTIEKVVEFSDAYSSDANAICSKLDSLYGKSVVLQQEGNATSNYDALISKTDTQSGIVWAQRQFSNNSVSNKKVMLMFSDTIPNVYNINKDASEDVAKLNDEFYYEASGEYKNIKYYDNTGKVNEMMTLAQKEKFTNLLPEVEIITLGVQIDGANKAFVTEFLGSLATKDNKGKAKSYVGSVDQVDNKVTEIVNELLNNRKFKIIDTFPSEFEYMTDSLSYDGKNISSMFRDNKIVIDLSEVTLENKVYRFSLNTKLDLSKVVTSMILNKETIYTNGTTIDITKDSLGSAYFEYSSDARIELESPRVSLDFDKNVEQTKIKIDKSAKWAKYNGKAYDSNGNPYVKTTFSLDLSEVEIGEYKNLISDSQSSDFMFLIDVGSSMSGAKLEKTIEGVRKAVANILENNKNARISIKLFAGVIYDVVLLDSSASNNVVEINRLLSTMYGKVLEMYDKLEKGDTSVRTIIGVSDLNEAIIAAQREFLGTNVAEKQTMIIVSDGIPQGGSIQSTGNDVVKNTDDYYYSATQKYDDVAKLANSSEAMLILGQMEYMKLKIPNMCVTTLGLDLYADTNTELASLLFENMASVDTNGEALYYDINISDEDIISKNMLDIIAYRKSLSKAKIVDLIPSEYLILEDTVKTNNEDIKVEFDKDKIEFDFAQVDFVKKVYTIEFFTALNIEKIPENMKNESIYIYTNGTTLDTQQDSLGSAYFLYGAYGKIDLKSPRVIFDYETMIARIGVSKTASWKPLNGKQADEDGNLYSQIEFKVDLTETNLEDLESDEGTTDMVVLIDCATYDGYCDKYSQFDAANKLIEKFLGDGPNSNRRVAVAAFHSEVIEIMRLDNSLSNDAFEVRYTINSEFINNICCSENSYTNMQAAIVWAQRQFMTSYADKKTMVIISDGEVDTYVRNSEAEDVVRSKDTAIGKLQDKDEFSSLTQLEKEYFDKLLEDITYDQMEFAKYITPGLEVVTMNTNSIYELDEKTQSRAFRILENLASSGFNGEKLFYKVTMPEIEYELTSIKPKEITINSPSGGDDDIAGDAKEVYEVIGEIIENINLQGQIQLIDIIPKEYDLVEDTIEVNDVGITHAYNNNKLIFTFDKNSLTNKEYIITFYTKLVLPRVSTEILENNEYVYTNGETIDVNKDSKGSSYLICIKKRIDLESPKLQLLELFNVILHTNGGTFVEGKEVTKYLKGIGIALPVAEDINKLGYDFDGWYDNPDFNGSPVTKITDEDEGDKEFWAKWENKNTQVKKQAKWTSIDGKEADENGNPYAEIEFNVDLTSLDVDKLVEENSSIDVVFLLDYSGNTVYDEGNAQYTAVCQFAEQFLQEDNRRIALAGYKDCAKEWMSLNNSNSSNAEAINTAAQEMFYYYHYSEIATVAGADMQGALIWAQRQLKDYSNADKKVIIIISGGTPDTCNANGFTGDDVIETPKELLDKIDYAQNVSGRWTEEIAEGIAGVTLAQAEYAKSQIEGLEIITLGLNLDQFGMKHAIMSTKLLKNIATVGISGEKNFYSTNMQVILPSSVTTDSIQTSGITINAGNEEEDIIEGEGESFITVINRLPFDVSGMLQLKLVDYIPAEFELLDDTLYSSDVSVQCEYKENKLIYTFDCNNLEKKVYTFRFNTKLIGESISRDILSNCDYIYTNGTTIDTRLNSKGSSYLQYGREKIDLDSPKISLDLRYGVTLHPNGGTILAGKNVTEYKRGLITFLPKGTDVIKTDFAFEGWYDNEECIGEPIEFISATASGDKEYWAKWTDFKVLKLTKSAEWTKYNTADTDASGNPYAKISFEVDLTSADPDSYYDESEITTDVVLLMDTSKSVWDRSFVSDAMTAVSTFAENLMVQNDKTRIAIGMFGESVHECTTLANNTSANINTINAKIGESYNALADMYYDGKMSSYKDIQGSIIWAQRQLRDYSDADRKIILLFSHGEGNAANMANDKGEDVINMFNNINSYTVLTEEVHEKINTQTIDQMEYARNSIENLSVITVGMGFARLSDEQVEARSTTLLHNLASLDDTNDRMFYIADIGPEEMSVISTSSVEKGKITINAGREEDDEIILDSQPTMDVIGFIIEDILEELKGMIAIRLVDKIPSEFGIFKSSIVKSDEKVITQISGNTVQFVFPAKDLEKKVYNFTFITKLFMDRVSEDIKLNNDYVYSNGSTIDITKNSLGSAYITFGKNGRIELESPKLELKLYHNVTLHPEGGIITPGKEVTFYREGVGTVLPSGLDIKKENYTFSGWYDNKECTGTPVAAIGPTERGPREYWAKWTPNIYQVILHPNGGVYEDDGLGEITNYTYGIGTSLPTGADIVKDGFDFEGWYDNSNLTGNPVTEIPPTASGPKEYWAKWKEIVIPIDDNQENVYVAVGYDELYKANDIIVSVDEGISSKITAYLTKGMSKTSKIISEVKEFNAFEKAVLKLPDNLISEVAHSKDDGFVYLQIIYGTTQKTIRIRLRICGAFEEY